MMVFAYFWDKSAELLIVTCELPDNVDSALVLVSRSSIGSLPEPVAVVPVERCNRQIAPSFAIRVAQDDLQPDDVYEFSMLCERSVGPDVQLTDKVQFDGSASEDFAGTRIANWSVHGTADGPAITLSHPGDPVTASTLLSPVLASRFDGDRLMPGILGDGTGTGATIEIQTDWVLPAPQEGAHRRQDQDQVVQMTLRPRTERGEGVTPTFIRTYSLMAAHHVCGLLEGTQTEIDLATCNKAEMQLGAHTKEAKAFFPLKGVPTGDVRAFPLGLNDRIIVATQPPAKLQLRVSHDRAIDIGKDGVAVLVHCYDGSFKADNGALLNTVAAGAQIAKVRDDSVFVSHMNDCGLSVSLRDLDGNSVLSVLLAAETKARVGKVSPRLTPHNMAMFRQAPQFYACLAAQDPGTLRGDMVNRLLRSVELDTAERCGLLGRLILDRDLREENARFAETGSRPRERLALWLQSDKAEGMTALAVALSPRLQELIQAGVSLEWWEIEPENDLMERDVGQLERLLDQLTRAKVIANDATSQFFSLSDTDSAIKTLRGKLRDALNFLRAKAATYGVTDDKLGSDDAALRLLIEMRDAADPALIQLRAVIEKHDLQRTAGYPEGFLRRVSLFLAPGLRAHFAHVQSFVAAGFSAPETLETQGIQGAHMAEPQHPFRGPHKPVPEASVAWVLSDDPAPEVVQEWRAELRRHYQSRLPSSVIRGV